jgi:hypothetical protein
MNHGQIQTHKTHHDPNLGVATSFPFIVYSMTSHRIIIQMAYFLRLPSGSPEIPKVGTPTTFQLWGFITLCVDLWLKWFLRKSCSLHWELSNDMSHVTWTWRNRGDPWLLMFRRQTVNLTPNLFLGHNLCFRCPNGSCKPISNIYVPRDFQWCKECFNSMNFDPWNCFLKIQKSIWDSNSQNGSSLGSVKIHSFTLFCTPGSMRCDSQASVLACTLTSPCLGHEPKARVATNSITMVL